MKKLTTAALAAVLALAMTAVAISQTTSTRTHTMDAKVTPSDSGTKKKPKSVTASVSLQTPANEDSNVDKFTFLFDEGLKISTKGFKRCTVSDVAENGNVPPAKCAKAKVGSGQAIGSLGRRTANDIPLRVQLYALDENELLVYVDDVSNPDAPGSLVKRAFTAVISSSSDPDFGQQIKSDIPPDLESVGAPVILESLGLKIGKQIKRRIKGEVRRFRIISSRKCPPAKQWLLGSTLEYNLPQGAADTTAKDTTPCTK